MSNGTEAARRGNFSEAKKQFRRAVNLAPGIGATHAALGSVLLQLNETSAGIDQLQTAHKLSPQDTDIDVTLAKAQVSTGQFAAATELFREVISSNGHGKLTDQDCVAFATALSSAGQDDDAESVLRAAIGAIAPSAALSDALGTILAKRGSFEEALPLFQDAVSRDPASPQGQAHLGSTLLALGNSSRAIPPLLAAVGSDPGNFAAELDLGRALAADHKQEEAVGVLHKAAMMVTGDTPDQAVYMLALALQANGDPRSALPLFERVETKFQVNREFLINYALAQVQTGNAKAAIRSYARAVQTGPDTATLRQDFGVAFLQEADLDHAIEQFRLGLALDPDNAALHYDLGLAYKLRDNIAAAIPELERAGQLEPTLADPSYTLGILYMQQGRFRDAAAQFRRTISLQPRNGDAWALLGAVLKDDSQASEAVEALRHAIQLQPDQPNLHVQLAALKLQAGDKEGAAAERKLAADLSRGAVARQRASFAINSARALLQEGKFDDALTQLTIASQADPSLSEPHTLLATIYERLGKSADAAVERQKAGYLQAHASPATNENKWP
jgi:tetratricopeptide (TPR) repeat protein